MTEDEWAKFIEKDRQQDFEGRVFLSVVLGIPFCLAIDFFKLGRPLLYAFFYSIAISVVILVAIGIVDLSGMISRYKNGERLSRILFTDWYGKFQVLALGFGYYTIGAALHDLYLYLEALTSGRLAIILITVTGTLSVAGMLFYFRLKKRMLYGITEIVVGVTIASYRATAVGATDYLRPEFLLVILTAGVYLIVRGMDNMHQAIKSKQG